jgi:hypothetical protein
MLLLTGLSTVTFPVVGRPGTAGFEVGISLKTQRCRQAKRDMSIFPAPWSGRYGCDDVHRMRTN